MAIEAGGRPPFNQDEYLTLAEAGAKSDLSKDLEDIKQQQKDQLASVTDLGEYRAQRANDYDTDGYDEDEDLEQMIEDEDTDRVETKIDRSQQSKRPHTKPQKKIDPKKVVAASAVAIASLQGAKMAHEAIVARPEPVSVTSPQESFAVEDFPVGSELAVSPYSYVVTGGNIRTSPKVVEDNLLDHTDFSGDTIEHPIVVADDSNPQNDDWLEFVDSKGKTLYTNLQNVEVVQESTTPPVESTIHVTVTQTGNHGITASDGKGNILTVATVVNNS